MQLPVPKRNSNLFVWEKEKFVVPNTDHLALACDAITMVGLVEMRNIMMSAEKAKDKIAAMKEVNNTAKLIWQRYADAISPSNSGGPEPDIDDIIGED